MNDKETYEEDEGFFPHLNSLRGMAGKPEVPADYFSRMQDQVMARVKSEEAVREEASRGSLFFGWSLTAAASIAAALLMLVVLRFSAAESQVDANELAKSVSTAELLASIDVRDYDMEMVAGNMGSEAMAAIDLSYHEEKQKLLDDVKPQEQDSIAENMDTEFLRDIDPSELSNL